MRFESETELPPAYNTLHVGIGLYDVDTGTILDANDRLETILGYETEELRDLTVEEYTANTYPHSRTDFETRLTASADGTPQQFTWRVKRADGELIWVQVHLEARTLDGRRCLCAEVRDITDYYETNHRAELFWRILRHNLRNEAAVITGHANRITANTVSDSVREASEIIQSRAENLGNIAESVQEIERAVTQTDASRVRRHATSAVTGVISSVSGRYPNANITVDERAEMWIQVDTAFTHALSQALENAIVHSDESAPVVETSIGPSPNTGRVEISISDRNPLIPDDEIDAVFTPTETTDVSHGSGVGLFVMKWCIESLGGEITFERRGSRGNTIYFYLPPKTPPGQDT